MARKSGRKQRGFQHRIPDREAVIAFLRKAGRPRNLKHIADALGVESAGARAALSKRLKAMVRDGDIIQNRREGYGLVKKMDLIVGTVWGHPDGFGFLGADEGGDDLFIPAKEMRALLHGDRAVVRVTGIDRRGRREAAVVEVLSRAHQRIVGRFIREGDVAFVEPDNRRLHLDILIPKPDRGNARNGQFVVAEITAQPTRHTQPVGRITEILGSHATSGLATELAMRSYELPHQWPEGVRSEIAKLDAKQRVPLRGRTDLRDLPFVTIDGETARDFDDAVWCERAGKEWRLMVAIADVSHYVRPGSALDTEARERGTSVYFPDRVIPMLPEVLSNELCSLNPGVDRLAMVCELTLGKNGKVRSSRFFEAVIRSAARLTYSTVAAVAVDRDAAARREAGELARSLDDLYGIYQTMHRLRQGRGLLDFRTTETALELDAQGQVKSIGALIRNDAHRMIEEFMLAANVAAAERLQEAKLPALYRNHEPPKTGKLEDLREFLSELGLSLGGGEEPQCADYATLMDQIKDRKDAHLIETLLLRSMSLAVYSHENAGHFGLAFDAYTHFTSPIRRYPDLLVHRAIRHLLGRHGTYPYNRNDMQELGAHCSKTERRADEATRDVVQRLKCEYMRDKVGEEFPGAITSVTGFGLFVELEKVYVEGLVHVTSLPNDYYHFDPVRHQLRGERRGAVYRLANRVRVRVMRVDVDDRQIDFELVQKK